MAFRRLVAFGLVTVSAGALAVACSSTTRPQGTFDPDSGDDASTLVPEGGSDGPSLINPETSTTGCPEGSPTRVTGKVYDPAGKNALYNIQVFVPSGDLPPIPAGLPDPDPNTVRCAAGQTCDSQVLNPKAAALTNTKGEFELKGPKLFPGKDVPLVMQVGKWRRKIIIPEVKACEETKLPAADTRLPKNGAEGDMPHMMMVLGSYDALECLLYGIGIDKDEFVPGYTEAEKNKHVHVFKGIGGGATVNGRSVPDVNDAWSAAYKMQKFDIALLSCEGTPERSNKPNLNAFKNFADWGGRVFSTHYHSQWITGDPDKQKGDAWGEKVLLSSGGTSGSNPYPINTSFPKGQAFSDWLYEIGASSVRDKISLNTSDVSNNQGGLAPGSPAKEWIGVGKSAKYFSFNTPTEVPVADQCGRFVYSDIHAAGGGSGGNPLPNSECSGLSAQLTALEFMFFDLSSCVQDETKPPEPPK
ncbi:MAG: hypothetical protein IPF92_30070 [Myxococcales bacterium]|nr:hypothetical protein [Myxococcales bacterium]